MKENGLNITYLHGWKGTWASEFYEALGRTPTSSSVIDSGLRTSRIGVKELAKNIILSTKNIPSASELCRQCPDFVRGH
jgi:hypothetical protein